MCVKCCWCINQHVLIFSYVNQVIKMLNMVWIFTQVFFSSTKSMNGGGRVDTNWNPSRPDLVQNWLMSWHIARRTTIERKKLNNRRIWSVDLSTNTGPRAWFEKGGFEIIPTSRIDDMTSWSDSCGDSFDPRFWSWGTKELREGKCELMSAVKSSKWKLTCCQVLRRWLLAKIEWF